MWMDGNMSRKIWFVILLIGLTSCQPQKRNQDRKSSIKTEDKDKKTTQLRNTESKKSPESSLAEMRSRKSTEKPTEKDKSSEPRLEIPLHLANFVDPLYRPLDEPDYQPEDYQPDYQPEEYEPKYQPEYQPNYKPEYIPKYQPPYKSEYNPRPVHTPYIYKEPEHAPSYDGYEKHQKPYAFDYGVTDDYSGANFGHSEKSNGNEVEGSYSVALPDGRIQTVRYTAGGYNGFQAEVTYEGKALYPKYAPYKEPYNEPYQDPYNEPYNKPSDHSYKPEPYAAPYKSKPYGHPAYKAEPYKADYTLYDEPVYKSRPFVSKEEETENVGNEEDEE